MRIRLFPYKMGSVSATALRGGLEALGFNVRKVRPDGNYRYRTGDKIINWGNSRAPEWMSNEAVENTLNKPHNVSNASNKLNCFQTLFSSEIPTVPFTTDPAVARGWDKIYVRHVLNGHSGEGIEIVEPSGGEEVEEERDTIDELRDVRMTIERLGCDSLIEPLDDIIDEHISILARVNGVELPAAPLYTRAVENHGEYRVHVFNGEVIDYRKKSRHHDDTPEDGQNDVRTLGNGWIYRASNLARLERIENLAVSTIAALGLDFGAVDIIKDEDGEVMVLEVNTACGMDDVTLGNYLTAISNYYAV